MSTAARIVLTARRASGTARRRPAALPRSRIWNNASIGPEGSRHALVGVRFCGSRSGIRLGELDELVLAYATTIHKSQGSEYAAVVIPLTTQHYQCSAHW